MNSDVKNTIREALRYKREALIELTTFDILDDADKQALIKTVAAIDAALAALDEQPTPLDMPDGPGWWGGVQAYREFVVQFTEFTVTDDAAFVRWAGDEYTMRYPLTQFEQTYRGTKWYRLTMPWENQTINTTGE